MGLTLHDKGGLVKSLWHSVDGAAGNLANVPALVSEVIETGAWREREQDGETYTHKTFLSFIETPPLSGCGWPKEKVEALIKDDADTLVRWRRAITGKQGAHSYNVTMSGRGNSRAYTLSRLKRERPDLFAKVAAGELSANAAAVEAGWRKRPEPLDTALKAFHKLSAADQRAFLKRIRSEAAA